MKIVAYDTSILLSVTHNYKSLFEGYDEVVITDITWQELKRIKDSKNKTEEVRKRARDFSKLITKYINEIKITFAGYKSGALEDINKYVNDDDRIIYCIEQFYNKHRNDCEDYDFCFHTADVFQYTDACRRGIPAQLFEPVEEIQENYKGFKEFYLTDEEWINFYARDEFYEQVLDEMLINEYIIIHYHNKDGEKKEYCAKKIKRILDGEEFFELEELCWPEFHSYQFGDIKPRDCYQHCLMDSLNSNQFTIITGPAGSGKSHLALAALFEKLDRHEIDKIVMLVNPVCTDGAAKLGYYKGTRTEKLLDCQVGGFLANKFGWSTQAQQYIEQNKLELIPFSDLRGIDLNDKKAGVFITEAQNLDISLMKLAIQRAGEDSIFIAEGDPKAQLDMEQYRGVNNGMLAAIKAFKGEDLFGMIELQKVQRSRLAEIAEKM